MDTENLIALATEEDTIPCNEDRNIKQGLSKRLKLSALTVVVVLLVGLGLTSVAVQQKSPVQASTNNFIQENMDQDMLNAVNRERKTTPPFIKWLFVETRIGLSQSQLWFHAGRRHPPLPQKLVQIR